MCLSEQIRQECNVQQRYPSGIQKYKHYLKFCLLNGICMFLSPTRVHVLPLGGMLHPRSAQPRVSM